LLETGVISVIQVIDSHNRMAVGEEILGYLPADETGAAGDKNLHLISERSR